MKAFIDKNLQMQVPELDQATPQDLESKKPSIFSHYCQDAAMANDLTNIEFELNEAISEAQQTHEAWKKMQAKLSKLAQQIEK